MWTLLDLHGLGWLEEAQCSYLDMLVGLGLMLLTSMGELNGRWGLSTSSLPGMCPLITQESESEGNKLKVQDG